ncbi:hypothetical protein [Nannocystis sp. SCPEA4]|uniref:hypothetical protein n=1 Tax=Nannocystis sp. SCPEA4 TaxID=2996787 RepID=UPI00227089F6|nr:hypothetical protein [Nannocystis sp. SCPEA4]MCY1059618.1 hypothetical protein [Nannocystis sp. SCPEA4]
MHRHRSSPATFLALLPFVLLPACPDETAAPIATDAASSSSSAGSTPDETTDAVPTGTGDGSTTAGAWTTDTTDDTTTGPGDPPVVPPVDCPRAPHFSADKQPQRFIHVAPDGVDSPTCGDSDNPCASISGAAARGLTPGTAVQLHEGTYATRDVLEDIQGTADAPIWIGGVHGEALPIIRGPQTRLKLSKVRWLVLHDLAFESSHDDVEPALRVDDGEARDDPEASRWVALDRLVFTDAGDLYKACVELAGVNDFWIFDSEFTDCGQGLGDGIELIGSRRGQIVHNRFWGGQDGMSAHAGSEDVEFRANWVYSPGIGAELGGVTPDWHADFRPPVVQDAENVEARAIRAIANLFVDNLNPVDFAGCVECMAAHNTIIRPTHLFGINSGSIPADGYAFAKAANGRFVNNLVWFERATVTEDVYRFWNAAYYTEPETFVARSNLWYASDDPARSAPDLAGVQEVGSIIGSDPKFSDLEAKDYRLAADSPARQAGWDFPQALSDLDDDCYGDPPNIGAYAWP